MTAVGWTADGLTNGVQPASGPAEFWSSFTAPNAGSALIDTTGAVPVLEFLPDTGDYAFGDLVEIIASTTGELSLTLLIEWQSLVPLGSDQRCGAVYNGATQFQRYDAVASVDNILFRSTAGTILNPNTVPSAGDLVAFKSYSRSSDGRFSGEVYNVTTSTLLNSVAGVSASMLLPDLIRIGNNTTKKTGWPGLRLASVNVDPNPSAVDTLLDPYVVDNLSIGRWDGSAFISTDWVLL